MGIRSLIRDILIVYLAYRLFRIWLLGEKFTFDLALITLAILGFTFWFLIEKVSG